MIKQAVNQEARGKQSAGAKDKKDRGYQKPHQAQEPDRYKPDWWDAEILEKVKYLTVVMFDGEKMQVRVLGVNRFHVHVETEDAELLIPKHAIKYFVLREFAEGEVNEE